AGLAAGERSRLAGGGGVNAVAKAKAADILQKHRLTARVQGVQTGARGRAHVSGGLKQLEVKRPRTTETPAQRQQQQQKPQQQQQQQPRPRPSGAAGSPRTPATSSKGRHVEAVVLQEGDGNEGSPSR
ncbi:unnamed protein product, partial [Laminaria digitata]